MIITGIPFDEKLNIGVLSKVFERKRISNCYKYFWFQAILENIVEDKVVAQQSHRIGLRTVRLVNEKDQDGESFYFEVNGVPMFAKGANYIPDDALLPCITTERYKTLFRDMKEANMNDVTYMGGRNL